jgi:hypothetical protein
MHHGYSFLSATGSILQTDTDDLSLTGILKVWFRYNRSPGGEKEKGIHLLHYEWLVINSHLSPW